MGYRSKTYSLSDEVIEAIERAKAGGTSPNQFLRELMGLDGGAVMVPVQMAEKITRAPRHLLVDKGREEPESGAIGVTSIDESGATVDVESPGPTQNFSGRKIFRRSR